MNYTVALLSSLLMATAAQACPTCYSALADQSPPFFSQEAYKPFTTAANDAKAGESELNQTKKDAHHEEQKNSVTPATPAQ